MNSCPWRPGVSWEPRDEHFIAAAPCAHVDSVTHGASRLEVMPPAAHRVAEGPQQQQDESDDEYQYAQRPQKRAAHEIREE